MSAPKSAVAAHGTMQRVPPLHPAPLVIDFKTACGARSVEARHRVGGDWAPFPDADRVRRGRAQPARSPERAPGHPSATRTHPTPHRCVQTPVRLTRVDVKLTTGELRERRAAAQSRCGQPGKQLSTFADNLLPLGTNPEMLPVCGELGGPLLVRAHKDGPAKVIQPVQHLLSWVTC